MDSNKLSKYLFDSNVELHKIILRRIEKDSDNLEIKHLEPLIELHLKLSDKLSGYVRGMKQNEMFNSKPKK
jgi:hypothetical protein